MAKIICPDCKNEIDNSVELCPFCGCPQKYFDRSDEREIETQLSFVLGPAAIGYPQKGAEYAKLYGTYSKVANEAEDTFLNKYKELGNIENAISTLSSLANSIIDKSISDLVGDLNHRGIDITTDSFYEKYSDDYNFKYSKKIEYAKKMYNEVLKKKDRLELNREISKSNRMRWQGGGFGLKGAIKGVATAAVLNAGADLLHAPGDASRASRDKRIVNEDMASIYYSEEVRDVFCNGIRECLMEIFYAYANILERHGKTYIIPTNIEKAKEYYSDFKKISKNNFRQYSKTLFECITHDPSNRKYWDLFLDIVSNFIEDDIDGFMSFWNIEYLYPNFKEERAIGKDFDEKWDKYKNDIGWEKGATPEAYTATRRFCLDYNKGDFDKPLPKYSFRAGEFKAFYENIGYNRNNFMTWYDTIEWIPEGIKIEDFFAYLRFERQGLPGSYLGSMWLLGDGDYYFTDEDYVSKISQLRKMNPDEILMVVDTSKNYNAINGLVLTKSNLVHINTQSAIPCKDVTGLDLYTDDSIDIYGNNKKKINVSFPKDEHSHAASAYLERLIRVILVRYFGNEMVREEKMKSKAGSCPFVEPSNSLKNDGGSKASDSGISHLSSEHKLKDDINDESIISYIKSNFTIETKAKAISYYQKITGVDLKTAKDEVDNILTGSTPIKNEVDVKGEEVVINRAQETVKSETMFCPFCGKQIQKIAKFCNFCGKENPYRK